MRRGGAQRATASIGVEPTPERRRQGEGAVRRRALAIEDETTGRTRMVMVWQGVDTLGRMLEAGRISAGMHRAGGQFHGYFRRAGLDRLWAAAPDRLPVQLGGGVSAPGFGDEAARLQVAAALDALGGWQAPAGSCAFHVLGCETSLRTWALTISWATGRIDHHVAGGILIGALGILEAHWGPRPRAGRI